MQTKLSAFCERVMEAGWLAALIIEPLFFNVYSDRVFEPDKIALLRSIALVLIAAWAIKLVEDHARPAPSEGEAPPSLWRRLVQIPLVLPTLLLVAVYILATLTSIVPRSSLWGSYQRLQGTYSTLSYIVILGVILSTLRRREQLERLIHIAILVSLPIALYGLIQHFGLDPLPWGGNVTRRVASNMGNSIFVAAYMIMIVPLTLRNLLSNLFSVLEDEDTWVKLPFIIGGLMALIIQAAAWLTIGYVTGLLIGVLFTLFMGLFALAIHKPLLKFLWIGAHGVILVAQLACIFFTQSRGPWLGLMAGLFFFVLVYAFSQRIRWLQLLSIALALAGALFLAVLNMPNTPLAAIKKLPYVGRLGRILETEQGTGKVRVLIWEGATQLIGWHDPIGLPGQEDKLNALRPIIGYGPESMIVAYNPFYPPDLAHYERRNASPDRSHNETFDALIQTGAIGFLVYFSLYVVVFYHSLKWLGLIENRRHRHIFLGLGIGGAALGVLVPLVVDGSLRYAGVGIPFGFSIGMGLYLILSSFIVSRQERALSERQLLLMALLSAILAHFIEIHFGIAIASTRTYFWTYAAVLVVVGMGWVSFEAAEPAAPAVQATQEGSARRKRSRRQQAARRTTPGRAANAWRWAGVVAWSVLVALLFVTLAFDFITNQEGLDSAGKIVARSLTMLLQDDAAATSPALLWMMLFTWFVGGLFALSQTPEASPAAEDSPVKRHLTTLAIYAGITIFAYLVFALSHAGRLVPGSDVARTIAPYFWAVFALLFAAALALWREAPLPSLALQRETRWVQAALIPLSLAICVVLIQSVNLGTIKADIYYKQGKHYDQTANWDVAIRLYQEAINYARDQDYYYLFLGRAYLQKAIAIADPAERAPWVERAQQTLEEARRLNPLNTDHSANLARLHRTIGEMTDDPAERQQALSKALAYYDDAITLSPNTAKLYNEWGLVYAMTGDLQTALAKFQKSLSLDDQYEETYLYLGNYYLSQQRYDESAAAYQKALEIKPSLQAHSALAYVYSKQGKLEEAVEQNLAALQISPADYDSNKNLAILYQQLERYEESLAAARTALARAPDDERAALESFIAQLESVIKASKDN